MKRGIVIPTFNEQSTIARVITDSLRIDPELNIIVVDDNSPDGTAEVVKSLSLNLPNQIKLITQTMKHGLAMAYINGFIEALNDGWDLIGEMDADMSHQPAYLKKLFHLARSYDLVIGSRYTDGGGIRNWSMFRKLLSLFGNFYARSILNVGIRDITSGFRCYRRKVLESISLEDISSNGYSFQIETAYRTHLNGFRITETPIVFIERESGSSKMSNTIILEAIFMVWRLRMNKKELVQTPAQPIPAAVLQPFSTPSPARAQAPNPEHGQAVERSGKKTPNLTPLNRR